MLAALLNFGCWNEGDPAAAQSYPLLALFDAAKTLDGKNVEVIGYFGFWDGDIPVLYASMSDFQVRDGLYKSHIIFKGKLEAPKANEMNGKLCRVKAAIWYRGTTPTLDQAELIACRE